MMDVIHCKLLSNMEREFYLTEEVAEMLRVSTMTVYRAIKAGRLTAYKFGRDWRIRKEDLEAYLQAHRSP